MQGGLFVIKEHMRAARLGKVGKIVDFLLTVEKNPLGFAGFNCVILADSKSLPYYLADYLSGNDTLLLKGRRTFKNNNPDSANTDYGYITLAPGKNNFEVTGADDLEITFSFPFMYLG